MRKKLLFLLLIPLLVLTLTACDKKEEKKKETKDDKKSIVLEDTGFGYKTTFKYDKKEKFTEPEEETGGRSTQITFNNEDMNLEFEMYYTDMYSKSYDTTKETRSKQKYYKEYTFGKYQAYVYGEYDTGLNMNILLETDKDEDKAKILFVAIDKMDINKEKSVSEIVEEQEVQDFFNSITFEKIK